MYEIPEESDREIFNDTVNSKSRPTIDANYHGPGNTRVRVNYDQGIHWM